LGASWGCEGPRRPFIIGGTRTTTSCAVSSCGPDRQRTREDRMTLASWANTIVLVALGLCLGAVACLARLLAPPVWEDIAHSRRQGEGFFEGSRRRADEQAELMTIGPRGFRLASYAQLALFLVLVLTVWVSPVELGWWTLLLSLGAGATVMWLVFRLARSGRLQEGRPSRLDPLAGIDISGLARASTKRRKQSPPPAMS
jgi:hypothetical protein